MTEWNYSIDQAPMKVWFPVVCEDDMGYDYLTVGSRYIAPEGMPFAGESRWLVEGPENGAWPPTPKAWANIPLTHPDKQAE